MAGLTIDFTDERLPNGLRLIIAEDHVAPVVAVNLWYGVGSKHEAPGKTGFAHLFEHVMFQGSAHVSKAEHIGLIQSVGGTMNGTTWLDRTNYFETVPSHQLEVVLWLEADRMGTLLDALSQENLDNQREVVKNEKRWSYDNRPYGSWIEKVLGGIYPPEHPYHHPTIGSMADLDAASLEDVSAFFRTHYAPNNAVLSIVGDVDRGQARAWVERYFGGIPANPALPLDIGDMSLPLDHRGRAARDGRRMRVPLPADLLGLSLAGLRRPAPRCARPRRPDPRRRQGQSAPSTAGPRRAPGPGREPVLARPDRWRIGHGGLPRPPGRVSTSSASRPCTGRNSSAWPRSCRREDELARAKALTEADELGSLQRVEERADRLSMYATLFDDPGVVNDMLPRYLAVTAEQIRDACRDVFRVDNRYVLTYLPAADASGARGGLGMSAWSRPTGRNAPRPVSRGPIPSRPSRGIASRTASRSSPSTSRAGRSWRASSWRSAARVTIRRRGRRDRPHGPRAVRGDRTPRRHLLRRGRRAPRCLAPRRSGLGCAHRFRGRAGRAVRVLRSTCSPRSWLARPSPRRTSSGCATNG